MKLASRGDVQVRASYRLRGTGLAFLDADADFRWDGPIFLIKLEKLLLLGLLAETEVGHRHN